MHVPASAHDRVRELNDTVYFQLLLPLTNLIELHRNWDFETRGYRPHVQVGIPDLFGAAPGVDYTAPMADVINTIRGVR